MSASNDQELYDQQVRFANIAIGDKTIDRQHYSFEELFVSVCFTPRGASIAAAARRSSSRRFPGPMAKRTLTKAYMLFLARWVRRLSWKETAEAFRTSWDVFDGVEHVVTCGLEPRV